MQLARLALLAFAFASIGASSDNPCHRLGPGTDAAIVVDADAAELHLCAAGELAATHAVNLGRGGLGKRRQGDRKTPLGRYELGPPRASVSGFTWFLPVGYPTEAQRARGFTGGAIGIHGPPDWIPQPVIDVAFRTPWTDGCIMVRTKDEIDAIRAWALAHRPRTIAIVRGPR